VNHCPSGLPDAATRQDRDVDEEGPPTGWRWHYSASWRVLRDGVAVEVPGSRLRGLLALLALSAGRPVDAAGLVGALWPEVLPADPANALQSLVSRLRRALGAAEVVTQTPAGTGSRWRRTMSTSHRFERFAAAGRARLRAGEAQPARNLLARAVALCPGPVVPEAAAVAPAVGVRLAHARIEAAADLAEADLLLGRFAEVSARLPALLAESAACSRCWSSASRQTIISY
jgi:DNA-binding SARP family transcriptional activator